MESMNNTKKYNETYKQYKKKKTKNSNKFKLVAHSKWTLTIFGGKKGQQFKFVR